MIEKKTTFVNIQMFCTLIKTLFIKSLIILLCLTAGVSYSQIDKKDSLKLIQLSGIIVSEGDVESLAYTTIYDKTIRKGVIADHLGFFSMVTKPGDTLLFSYYGHKTSSFIVPDTLTSNRYSIVHVMQKDTVNLPQVDVYPWPSREDFARAFVEMEPYDDALRRAQKQLSGDNLAIAAARVEVDAGLAANYAKNQMYTQIYTRGQTPVNNIFNPYSWAKLIDSWKNGDLKRE